MAPETMVGKSEMHDTGSVLGGIWCNGWEWVKPWGRIVWTVLTSGCSCHGRCSADDSSTRDSTTCYSEVIFIVLGWHLKIAMPQVQLLRCDSKAYYIFHNGTLKNSQSHVVSTAWCSAGQWEVWECICELWCRCSAQKFDPASWTWRQTALRHG